MPTLSTIGAACARAWGFTSGLVKDQYFNLVSLLLPGNGTNGAQNNTFLDSSSNTFTITRNGNTTQGTFSPFSQTGWGNRFDGVNGTALSIPYSSNYANFGTGDFTIECWLYQVAQVQYSAVITSQNTAEPSGGWILGNNNSDLLSFYVSGTFYLATDFTSYFNKWTHVAVVRQSGTLRLYINGVQQTTASVAGSITGDSANAAIIGRRWTNDNRYVFNGYISNLRIVKGTCLYNSGTTFTPSTTPLTAVSGTGLLTCQSNRFKDNSSNDFTITPAGNVTITPFSPFAPTQAYSAAAVGGSGYFDGTGDYLTIANQTALQLSGDFTIDGWIYAGDLGNVSGQSIIGDYYRNSAEATSQYQITWNKLNKKMNFYLKTSGGSVSLATSSGTAPPFSWNHFALVRSGSTIRLYCNGVGTSTATDSTQLNSGFGTWIGVDANNTSEIFGGYIANLRVVKGTAIYDPSQSTLTVPTALTTAVSGTSLLLNFTNAGVVDATAKGMCETSGAAQISTSVSKFGGGSVYFNGTSQTSLLFPVSHLYSPFTGDYTYEFWINFNSFSVLSIILETRTSGGSNPGLQLFCTTSGVLTLYGGSTTGTLLITGGALSSGQWYHIALVRSGSGSNNTKLYLNGTQTGSSATDTTNYNNQRIFLGAYVDNNNNFCNAYMDDFRFTKIARYTGNFTAPTAPFPVQ